MRTDSRTNTTPADDAVGFELTILDHRGVSTSALPPSGVLVIGRDAAADIRLDTTRVSRRHATLSIDGERFTIEDLGSSNGTIVNRQRVPAGMPVSIKAGDSIQIGELILVVTPRYPAPAAVTAATSSPVFQAVLDQVATVSPTDVHVLLLGETGVGKDVLARRVHALSARRNGPFVRINCAALTESLLESELFGHERGAFSGAVSAKPGLLEAASSGTVFLDEVGELPEPLQAKLLHAVENREVTRVGSVQAREIDVRFIAATNRDLSAEVEAGRFRADLFYRLSTFVVTVPPLRERGEDIELLARELITECARKFGVPPPALEPAALDALVAYAWPGNVRELRNVIERALVLAKGGKAITRELLPASLGLAAPRERAAQGHGGSLKLSPAEQAERQRIIQALVDAHGNQSAAARTLGISRTTLLQKLDIYRISRPRKRPVAPE